MTDAQMQSLQQDLRLLKAEHQQLDALVNRMCTTQVFGDAHLQRLKRRRLFLKDRLAILEHKLRY